MTRSRSRDRRRRAPAAITLALLAGAALSCAEGDDPPITWEGEHIVFGGDADAQACAGTLAHEDALVARLAELLEVEAPRGSIEYYWLGPESYEDGGCPLSSWGCYSRGVIRTRFIPHEHELVHAVLDLRGEAVHPFFDEGLAELFGADYPNYFSPQPRHGAAAGLAYRGPRALFPANLYGRAGHFVRFLVDTRGLPTTLELVSAIGTTSDPDDMDERVRGALGLSLEALLAEYKEYPECSSTAYRWPVLECDAAPTPWVDASRWQSYVTLGCERDDVIGPRGGRMWTLRTLEIPADGSYTLEAFGEDGGQSIAQLHPCGGGCNAVGHVDLHAGQQVTRTLDRGTYYVALSREVDAPGGAGLELRVAD